MNTETLETPTGRNEPDILLDAFVLDVTPFVELADTVLFHGTLG